MNDEIRDFIRAVLPNVKFVKDASELPKGTMRICVPLEGPYLQLPGRAMTWCSRCGKPCTYKADEMPLTNQTPLCIPCFADTAPQ